jgi:N-formylglutamate amidohydrolase
MRRLVGLFALRAVFALHVALLGLDASGREASPLVRLQAGDLPIIVSAPHGGTQAIPMVEEARDVKGKPTGGSGYVTARDTGTEELAGEVARSIERCFGKKPYFVIARSHRRYLDPNRPSHIAYEDPDAKPIYDAYHGALNDFCKEVQSKFHKGLLLDIHGQGSARDKVFRGTQDGKTVTLLRQRFGEDAVAGESSLFGRLKARGWTVHPDPLAGGEQTGYRGGYIVQTYGSHQGYGIDAIQLEFGMDYRAQETRQRTAATLTAAVADYAKDFLGLPPQSDPP